MAPLHSQQRIPQPSLSAKGRWRNPELDRPNHPPSPHLSAYPNLLPLIYAYIYVCIYFSFSGLQPWHREVPGLGGGMGLQLSAYATAHGNARSPDGPGIEPTSSWILVGFLSAVPQRKLREWLYLNFTWEHLKHLNLSLLQFLSEMRVIIIITLWGYYLDRMSKVLGIAYST